MKIIRDITVDQDTLDIFMHSPLWEQFKDNSFLFQHRSIKTEELDGPVLRSDLNPVEYLQDNLEQKL